MIGKQSITRPTALGTLLSSGAYGATIPNIYGCARSAPLPIWAANLRKGHSSKKGKKSKKSPPTYVENIDMMVGSNPIRNILQIWSNQSNAYPLNFVRLVVDNAAGGSWHDTIDLSAHDPFFYSLCAVTAICFLAYDPITFNDYGSPGPVAYGGSGGVGNNSYEFPLWNSAHHGPNLGDQNSVKFPSYNWSPEDGPIVDLASTQILDFIGAFLIPNPTRPGQAPFNSSFVLCFYYAQLSNVLKHESPLQFNRFTFENQLGNDAGGEYSGAGSAGLAQQITYPMYAGVGSPDMDLGSGPALPSWRFEVDGTGGVIPSSSGPGAINPRADAEFADIVEDIIRSGMMQYGAALGYVARGCNCNDLPGPVQKQWYQELETSTPNAYFNQPNTLGSILLASTFVEDNVGTPTISDTAANTWLSLFSSGGFALSYVVGCLASTGRNNVHSNIAAFGAEAYIMEFDPGSQAIDAIDVVPAAGGVVTASITTTSDVSYVVGIIAGPSGGASPPLDIHWQKVFPVAPGGQIATFSRTVHKAGTVITLGANLATGLGSGYVALFSVKSAQAAGTVPYPKPLGNILDETSMFNMRMACRAGGLQGSLTMDSQRSASEWLKDLGMAGNFEYVWGGFSLKCIARSEVSQIGNGSGANVDVPPSASAGLAGLYWAPTSTGPLATITSSDLIATKGQPSVTIERNPLTDANRIIQIQHFDRNNKYNQALTSQPETGSISLYGPRKDSPIVLNMIMDPAVARVIAAIEGRRNVSLLNIYKFKLMANLLFLEAMDLIFLNVPSLGLSRPLRLRKVVENDQFELECEAEDYIYGLHSPQVLAATTVAPYNPNVSGVPANVNTPIIFEPPLRMCLSGKPEVWLVVSDDDPNYGGNVAFASVDGGSTYPDMLGTIVGNATTGHVTVDFPASTDPDITDTLSVDLTESLGVLPNNSAADEASFTYPLYLAGATLYELAAYQTATLTGTNTYNIVGSGGNPIRRAVFGLPAANAGEDHPINSRFAWLDNRQNNTPPGILKVVLDPAWIGKVINFKFVQYNQFSQGSADISTVTAYSYTPQGTGTGTSGGGSGGGSGGSTSQPPYTLTGGALTNPTSTTIHMAAATAIFPGSTVYYDARTFTISAPGAPTTYYVTIADPNQVGDTGSTPTLTATCQTSNALVGVPGNVYIGSIVAQPAGGGTETGGGGFPPPVGISFDGV